jgi:hypothetical protein
MKTESKASLLKWGPLMVAVLALIPAYLMGPIAFTFKATMKDMLNQELAAHESTAAFAAKAQQDRDNDAFKRLEQSLALARDKASLSESNYARQLMELDARLIALETQVKRLKLEFESNGKRPSDSTGP